MTAVHVLLVQGDDALSEVLTEILQEHGLTVRSVTPRVAPADPKGIRLILADLPGKSAGDLRAFVQDVSPTPVGLLTSFDKPAEDVGAEFVLQKPIDVDELLAATATALALPDLPGAQTQRRLVDDYFAALAQNDWKKLATLIHEKIIYNLPTDAPHGGIIIGRESFIDYSKSVFGQYPDVEFTVERQLPLPLSRVASYTGSWRTSNGRAVLTGHVVFGFADDAVARVGVHLNAQRLHTLRATA